MVGRKVLVNHHPMTIIGVAAATFRGIDVGEVPSIWIPASMSAQAIPGFNDYLESPHALDAGAGPLESRHDFAESAGQVCSPGLRRCCRRICAAPGFPIITAERQQQFPQFVARAHCGAAGSFRAQATARGAVVGAYSL